MCLQSLKFGFFCDSDRIRRLSLCRGDGAFMQCGATKVGNQRAGFGLGGMGDLVAGSQYSLGVLFEVMINLRREEKHDSND